MKKTLAVIAILLALFTACTSSLDRDIRKMANLTCDSLKLRSKANEGNENAQKELLQLREKMQKMDAEMKEKYKNTSDDEVEKKSDRIFGEVLRDCK
jgi:Skp family chaperone for outer membrane proteins